MDGQEIKTALGKNIKYLRFHRGYSQADLAEKADISNIFLSNIERGVKFPKPEIMSRIATALEVEVFELFKADVVPASEKDTMNRLASDIHRNIDEVFKHYV
jgi:transcriptional regulator with XRE-family HTH domain